MKKLILIAAILVAGNAAIAQSYYYKNEARKRDFTFQVAPTIANYADNTLYGFSIGVNVKEVFNVSYFHTRSYKSTETSYMDTRWAGLYAAAMLPLNECVQVGPVVRLNALDADFQKIYLGAEARFNLGWNTKLGVEYGKANHTGVSVKLIWNLY